MNGKAWPLSVVHFLVPKAGLMTSECEDAVAVCQNRMRYCVADGATEAFDSRRWAKLLTKCWAANNRLLTKEEFAPWLAILGSRLERRWGRRQLPWYAEAKARSGAFAAFAGIAFLQSEGRLAWQAVALGDCCLIHTRDHAVVAALPISKPEEFGYHPQLIPSNLQLQQGIVEQFTVSSGHAEKDDVFLLLTDAIAAWYLRISADNPTRIHEFDQVLDGMDVEAVERFVTQERADKSLRNDDVAIMKIAVGAPRSEPLVV
jgi:hypothetical protein